MLRQPARLLPILLAAAFSAQGQEPEAIEELVVYGRAESRIGTAQSASEGLVGYADITLPPLMRIGELAEAVPGMVATQHSGTGKANQYFLRGFNLDHGTDFAAHIDGVPINLRSHGHGQGYLDLNFLIPELVATARYGKGPYAPGAGDFSSAGRVEFQYYERLPQTLTGITAGEGGYLRAVAAGSADAGAGVVTGAASGTRYDGPWQLDEDLSQLNAYLSYAFDLGAARARLAVHGYDSDWDATDQVPQRAVRSGRIDRLGYIDPDLGGETERWAATAMLAGDAWTVTGYLVDYDFTLFSNFTYLLEDPVLGDEFEQRDRRTLYGLDARGHLARQLAGRPLTLRWAAELRNDDIDEVGLYGTASRVRTDTVRRDRIEVWSLGLLGEAELTFTDRLRGTAGVRADHHDWDVRALQPSNGGSGDDRLLSPKLSLAYRFRPALEGYLSWARGFHSNDVRGATIRIDPVSGDPAIPVDVLVPSQGAEIGLRLERGHRFNATLAVFRLDLDSELVYVGDAGATEANDGTRRTGVEMATFWQATDWLAVNAVYTATDAEFRRDQGGGREIPGAVDETFTLGLTGTWTNGLTASARLRFLGGAPLIEDDSVRADESLLVNAGIAYRRGPVTWRLDAFNLLDARDADIAYFYRSRLPGEDDGQEDIHFHPLEPRSVRVGMTLHW